MAGPPNIGPYTHSQAMGQAGGNAYMGMLLDNPQMLGIADSISRNMWPGVPLEQLTRTDPNLAYAIKMFGAAAMEKGSDMFPTLIGSQAKLIGGAAFAAGGMHFGGQGYMRGTRLGQGAALKFTGEIVNRIGKEFFDSNGQPNANAHGFLQQDFGQLMAEMSNRRMFDGLSPVAQTESLSATNRAAYLKSAKEAGDKQAIDYINNSPDGAAMYKIDPKQMDKMMDIVRTQGMSVIDQAQKIFGKQSVQDLISLTEQTTGKSISSAAGRAAAMNTLPVLRAQARGQGLDPVDYARLGGATISAISRSVSISNQVDPSIAGAAATALMPAAMRIGSSAFEGNAKMRAHDDSIAAISREEATYKAMGGMLAAAEENPMLIAAAFAADRGKITGEKKTRYDALVAKMKGSHTKEELVGLNDQMADLVSEATGVDAYTYSAANGGYLNMMGALKGDSQRQISNALGAISNVESGVFLSEQAESLGTAADLGVSGDVAGNKMQRFFGLLDSDTQQGIMNALKEGPGAEGRIAGILRENKYDQAALGMSAEKYARELAQDDAKVRSRTGTGLDTTLDTFRHGLGAAGAHMFSNRRELENQDQAAQDALLEEQAMGENVPNSGTLLENGLRGIIDAGAGKDLSMQTLEYDGHSKLSEGERERNAYQVYASDPGFAGDSKAKSFMEWRKARQEYRNTDPGFSGGAEALVSTDRSAGQAGQMKGDSPAALKGAMDSKEDDDKVLLVRVVNMPGNSPTHST